MTAFTSNLLGAQEFATVPEGYLTLTIAAGTGTSRMVSLLSLPLQESSPANGQLVGRITALSASTISNSNAGWTAGQLSAAATPHCIRITSGPALGRTFLISTVSPNSSTSLSIDAEEAAQVDLTTLGIVAGAFGDTYEVIPCDTLSSVFGTPASTGILGGTDSASADIVQLFVLGTWREYYYNTTSARWSRVGPNTNSNNQAIRPDAAILFNRLGATPISLAVLGQVPATDRKALVKNSGITFLSSGWPVSLTLGTSGLQQIPGWISSPSSATADIVQLFVAGSWREYYYTGSQWKRVGPNTVSDSVVLPAGSAIIVNKKGSSLSSSTLSQPLPYSL